ncbi:ATP-binding protein [Streptomyces sp. NPDC005202]|uniref:ATP-binding protein n=1 Tax=Streptomyces sp. NPDC005202 TaxID=3157021 RepID=UPI00339E3591
MTASRAQRRGPLPSQADAGDGMAGGVPAGLAGPAEVAVNESLRLRSTVPADPSRAAAVRRLVAEHLAELALSADQLDTAVLATDELFANAVKHASTDPRDTITVTIEWSGRTLCVTVADRSPELPRPRAADAVAESGRGLAIVAALADDWGMAPPEPGSPGKRVWFTLQGRGAAP